MTGGASTLVLGSGAGGLSLALLLAETGRRVTVIECQDHPGGLLQRFYRHGIPFDTGFHFTGGFGGVLNQMLEVLGLSAAVRETPFRSRLLLAETGRRIALPTGGIDAVGAALEAEFPAEADGIRRYFEREKAIVQRTPMFDLRSAPSDPLAFDENEFITLDQWLDHLRLSPEVRTVLGSAALCHGSAPCEVPLAFHSRVSHGLFDHLARVEHGGDAFLEGFRERARELGIELRTGVRVTRLLELRDRRCHRVLLSDGAELPCDELYFAVHPRAVAELLPPELPGARRFREQTADREESCSFFSWFGVVEPRSGVEEPPELTSYISHCNLNRILRPGAGGATGIGMVRAEEQLPDGRRIHTLTAFATAFAAEAIAPGGDYRRDPAYRAYKERRCRELEQRILEAYPEYAGRLTRFDAASPLTFRRYDPPSGCAYGPRRRVQADRGFGRLPLRNGYLAGHGALIPGVLGTLMSSFLLVRRIIGEPAWRQLLQRKLKEVRS